MSKFKVLIVSSLSVLKDGVFIAAKFPARLYSVLVAVSVCVSPLLFIFFTAQLPRFDAKSKMRFLQTVCSALPVTLCYYYGQG